MLFSLLHPSRSRPARSISNVLKWIIRAHDCDFEMIISLDSDDPTLPDYLSFYDEQNFVLTVNPNRNAVQAVNKAAKLSSGDILIVVSDDTDCPPEWDKILTEAIGQEKDFVMKVADGIQKRIITMPIMDRVYFNRDGHIYDPDFRHSWADTFLTETAHHRGRVITRLDIKFPHDHYSVGGLAKDELYTRNDLTHDADRYIYNNKLMQLKRSKL